MKVMTRKHSRLTVKRRIGNNMKLLINKDLLIYDFNKDYIDLLKQYSVYHSINSDHIKIPVQKIVLDEYDMNILFDEILYGVDVRVTPLGGAGCDFCLIID